MANVIISPNMNLPIPVVGVDPGPDWANNVNASLSAIDGHSHTTGQGVPITPAAININTDLLMNGNNLTTARSVRFTSQAAVFTAPADIGCLYEVLGDLYYNDGSGNPIRFTQSGSIVGAAGTITGLPSGTASASFAGGTFTFQRATATGANIDGASYILRNNSAGSFGLTLAPPNAMAADTTITLPNIPAVLSALTIDTSGNIGTTAVVIGQVPIGGVIGVFSSTPGAYVCTENTQGDAFGYCLCQGFTLVDARSPMNGQATPALTSDIFLQGNTTSGGTGGVNSINLTHVHDMNNHTHNIQHYHQWSANIDAGGGGGSITSLATGSTAQTAYTLGTSTIVTTTNAQSGAGTSGVTFSGTPIQAFTTGALGTNAGDGNNARSGVNAPANTLSALAVTDNRPSYVDVVYVMRVF